MIDQNNSILSALVATSQEAGKDISNVLASANIAPEFHPHNVNYATGIHGITGLIHDCLRSRKAVFPKGTEQGALRPIVVAGGLYVQEIKDYVIANYTAGLIRYPGKSVEQYLSVELRHDRPEIPQMIVGFKLTNQEDSNRPKGKDKPRTKIYLIG